MIDKVNANKKIGWIHSDLSKQIILPEEREYYSEFDELITISDVCSQSLRNILPSQTVSVLRNVVLKEDILKKSEEAVNWDENKIHIVTVGRIEYVKGIDMAFEAAEILNKSKRDFQWHIFGKGSLTESMKQMVKTQKAEDFFIMEGETTNPYAYMRRAEIIVQPSRWEGKSIVLDEAKILGKAIVVTDYPSVFDQISDGVTGLIAKIDPGSIAQIVIRLMDDPNLRRELEFNCSQEANDSFQTIDKFYQLIEVRE